MSRIAVSVSEETKAAAFERVKAAMPKGVRVERLQKAEKPSHLEIKLVSADGEKRWGLDLVRQTLTDEVLAGFKRSYEHDKAVPPVEVA